MSYKEQFMADLAAWHGIDFTVTSIEQNASYYEGCPTCGGDMEYDICFYGYDDEGNRMVKFVDGKVSDFINYLE